MSTAIRAGKAFIEFSLENSAFFRDLRATEAEIRGWMQNVSLAGAAAGAGILGSFIPAVNAASDRAESLNAFREVFRGVNTEANVLANTLATKVGRSTESIKVAMTPIGAMVRGLGLAGDEAAKFASQATAAALDISSFFNTSTEDAFTRVRSALSGSSEAVDQFGINLRQSALELKLTEMGLDGNVQSASELEKALARLALIQESLSNSGAAGDLERTREAYANLKRTLSDSFNKLMAIAGDAVMPIATALVGGLTKATQAAAEWLAQAPQVTRTIAGIGAAALVGGAGLAALTSDIVHFTASSALTIIGLRSLWLWLQKTGWAAWAATAATAAYTASVTAMKAAAAGADTILASIAAAFGRTSVAATASSTALAGAAARGLVVKAVMAVTGASVWAVVAAFAAIVAAATAVGVWLYGIHKRTGALTPLFEALATAGRRVAGVWNSSIMPVFQKFSALMGGLFEGQADFWASTIEAIATLLGDTLVIAVEAAAGAVALLADEYGRMIGMVAQLLGIDLTPKQRTPSQKPDSAGAAAPGAEAAGPSEELSRFAEQVKQDVRTPAEEFAATVQQVRAAWRAGLLQEEDVRRKVRAAMQEKLDAERREFEDSPEGKRQQEIGDFAEQLVESTRTPLEEFQEQLEKINEALNARALTEEAARRGQEAAAKELQEAQERLADEARKKAEEARKQQIDEINDLADKRMAVAKALGDDQGEIAALGRHMEELLRSGFKSEGMDAAIKYLGAVVDRSEELEQEVAKQRDEADLVTGSAREAAIGLGYRTIDQEMLKNQEIATTEAIRAKDLLQKIHDLLNEDA